MELLRSLHRRLFATFVSHPYVWLALVLAVTILLGREIPKLRADSDMMSFVPHGDPVYQQTLDLEERFGSTHLTRIIVTRDDHPDGVYNPETLALVAEITDWLRARPEFETDRNSDLRSIATVNNIEADENGMIVEPFMEEPPTDREGALAIRRDLEANSAYAGVLASKDGKALSILVREAPGMSGQRGENVLALLAYLDGLAKAGHPEKLYASGRPVIEGLFSTFIPRETRRMAPFVLAMLCVFLFVSFRTLRGVWIPLLVIACTEAWMFGFLAIWDRPVYTVTAILPVLIMAIAVADSIHLLSQYYETQERMPEADRDTVVRETLAQMNAPVLMTSVTTSAGFMTMTSSAIRPLSDFGIIATAGVLAAYVITVVAVPALLAVLPLQRPHWGAAPSRGGRSGLLDRFLRFTAGSVRHPTAVRVGFLVIFAFSALGMLRLSTDSSQVSQFRPGHFLRTADEIDNTRFAGATVINVVVDAGANDRMKDPDVLRRIDALQAAMEREPTIGDTLSIAELVKRMNRVMNEDKPEMEVVPESKELVAQYLLLYSISGDPGDFDDLVDYDYRYGHILIFVQSSGTAVARAAVERAEALVTELFPPGPDAPSAVVSGTGAILAKLERYIVNSQLLALAICLPVMFGLMWMLFGYVGVALLCIVPVSLAVGAIYGSMGYLGIPTDIASTMLGGMTLGIGIDFAIHYVYRYRHARAEGADANRAAEVTALTAGRAIFYNATVLVGGFMVLMLANLYPQVKLGALISATMIICFLATMVLFPAALATGRFMSSDGDPSSIPSRDGR